MIVLGEQSTGLSSVAGSPADATMDVGHLADSSIASSLVDSGDSSLDLDSETPAEMTLESGAASPPASSGGGHDDPIEATLAVGATAPSGSSEDSDDDLDFDLSDEDGHPEEEEDEPTGEPSSSLDATIDLCNWAKGEDLAEVDYEATQGAEMSLGGAPRRNLLDPPDSPDAGDSPPRAEATMAFDSGQAPLLPGDASDQAGHDSRTEATLAADSDRASSVADSDQGSADLSNEPTLVFDSERRSTGVNTPEPLDITGLASGGTLPRGPLGEGRASGSLRPGDSQLIGEESVRLRAFRLADSDEGDPLTLDYAIQGEAGKGGMGIVYKARQQSLKRPVAIKQIKPDLGASDSDLNKFVSEAVITGQLEHPNIAPVHDLGLAADGLPFYAMKFVEGEDWEDSIKQKSEDENLGILIQVAQAIAFAHSKGVLHRDLKPGNVRLGSFGEVLVMDWGLAARLDGSAIQPAGTPIYMPPETALEYLDHARGKVVGGKQRVESSRRRVPAGTYCDIYLLGALLFKIVTGRAPHRGKTTFECLRNAARNEIVKTRRKGELLDIAYKAMASEPENRHTTAIEFIDALKAYQSHAQSIQIARRASKDLREAGRLIDEKRGDTTELYALFSSAQNGYQNALELWDGNRKAARRLKRTKKMFAESAYAGGDYDLALSLLDEDVDDAEQLRAAVGADQKSRKTRLAWFKRLQYATAVSLLLALAFIGYSVYAKLDAISARNELAETVEEAQRVTAKAEQDKARAADEVRLANETAKNKIRDAERDAERVKEQANMAIAETKANAERLIQIEQDDAKRKVEKANERVDELRNEAAVQAYRADIGRIRSTLLDRGAYAAWKVRQEVLQQVDPEVIAAADDPVWRYLSEVVDLSSQATELVGERPDGKQHPTRIARTGDGLRIIAVANDGPGKLTLTVYPSGNPEEPERTLQVDADFGPVATDATGRYVAIAGANPAVIDTRTGRVLHADGWAGEATCVAFHPSRPELLLGAADTSVETWSVSDQGIKQLDRDERWHQMAVTAVAYSPDGTQKVSADLSGRIVAWRLVDDAWSQRVTLRREGAGSQRVTALSVTDDRSGRLVAGYSDGAVYELLGWSAEEPEEKPSGGYAQVTAERLASRHAGVVTSVAYAEAGRTILSSGGDTLLVQDAPSGGAANETRLVERRYHDVAVLACQPGGAGKAYSTDVMGRVVVWSLDVADRQVAYQPRRRGDGVASLRLVGSGDNRSLLVADRAGFVRQWDDLAQPGRSDLRFVGHSDHREFRAWRLDGDQPRMITVAADNRAVVWRESDGLPERSIDLGGRTIVTVDTARGLLFAASDGREIADGPQAIAISLRDGSREPLWDDRARVARITPLAGAQPGEPTIAVGLRDGQVYLWGPQTGRVELTRSSGRRHWRPIVALTHDAANNRLLSADRGGLIAAWNLRDGGAFETLLTGNAAIRSLVPWTERRVVVNRGSEAPPVVLDDRLQTLREPELASAGLLAVAAGKSGVLNGLARDRGQTRLLSWSPTGWSIDGVVPWRATGLTAADGGRLVWGPGSAQWWGGIGPRATASRRVVSRTPAASLVESSDGRPLLLTRSGTVDPWNDSEALARLPLGGRLVAAAEGQNDSQALLAIDDGTGNTRIEFWDLTAGKSLRSLTEPLPGPVRTLTRVGVGCVVAQDKGLVFASPEAASQSVTMPEGFGTPQRVSANRAGDSVAVVTTKGVLLIARRGEDGRWAVNPTDRMRIDSAVFTAEGKRLLVGATGGRVEMLEVAGLRDEVYATRRLLSLTGHGDRITHLRVEPAGDGGATLLSGDASGLVLARPL